MHSGLRESSISLRWGESWTLDTRNRMSTLPMISSSVQHFWLRRSAMISRPGE